MLISTPALVLHTTLYAETSLIAKVFTRQLGLRSYIIKGVRSAQGRTKQNLLQTLSYLDMTVYDNPKRQLQYVKEMHPMAPSSAVGSLVRSSLLFFMGEVLYKALREEEPNVPLFDYVVSLFPQLDDEAGDVASFPLLFLLRVSSYLGIRPLDNYSYHEPLFHLREGRFLAQPSSFAMQVEGDGDYYMDASTSTLLHYFLSAAAEQGPIPLLTLAQRTLLMNVMIDYMHIHLDSFHNFKSLEILHDVLR